MNNKGEIIDTWFGRTVIRSAAQLAYEDAQRFIEGTYTASPDDTPDKVALMKRIGETIERLDFFAKRMRKQRYENGSVSLDSPKLAFTLDEEQNPIGVRTYERKDSHMMVEEWMLLANISVGQRIYSHFPSNALLRYHDPPNVVRKGLTRLSLSLSFSFSLCVPCYRTAYQQAVHVAWHIWYHRKSSPSTSRLARSSAITSMPRAPSSCTTRS